MIKLLSLVLIPTLILSTFEAWALEGRESNGGGSIVCRKKDNSIAWIEVLDLYEAKNYLGLTIRESNEDSLLQLQRVSQLLSEVGLNTNVKGVYNFIKKFKYNLAYVNNIMQVKQASMGTIEDVGCFKTPPPTECPDGEISYEQIANFNSLGVSVTFEKWLNLTETQRTALLVHEAVYYTMRAEFDDLDSARSRQITAQLMSTQPASYIALELELLLSNSISLKVCSVGL